MSDILKAPEGQMINGEFCFPIRVYFEDTDAGGIVYNANYLKFAERARTEFIRHLGFEEQQKILEKERWGFTVRRLEIDFALPAKLDDFLVATCRVLEQGGASLLLYQEIRRGDEVLAKLKVKVAYISLEKGKPIRIPSGLESRIAGI